MIAHVINITEINETKKKSYLHIAQPVTMQTMLDAKNKAVGKVNVELLSIKHQSENINPSEGFIELTPISHYAFEFIPSLKDVPPKPLPRLIDILDAAYKQSKAEFLIYTNLDIGLFPNFYIRIKELIDKGHDAITINRIDIPKVVDEENISYFNPDDIFRQKGKHHIGIDCVVFKRCIIPKLVLNNVFIGFPPIGQVLKSQVEEHSINPIWIKTERLTFHLGSDMSWQQNVKHTYEIANENEALNIYKPQFKKQKDSMLIRIYKKIINKF